MREGGKRFGNEKRLDTVTYRPYMIGDKSVYSLLLPLAKKRGLVLVLI